MSINVSELIWTVICFLVLLLVLKKLLYDPIIRFTDARNGRVKESMDAGKAAHDALEENEREIQIGRAHV